MTLNVPVLSVVLVWALTWLLIRLVDEVPQYPTRWTWRNWVKVVIIVIAIFLIAWGARS